MKKAVIVNISVLLRVYAGYKEMNHPGNVHSKNRGTMKDGDCDDFMLVYMKRKYYERDLAYLNMIDSFTQVHIVCW